MAFWTGLEAITGHPAGAFKGMSMSDWFDNEKWQRMPRTWSGQMQPKNRLDLRTNRAGEPMYTKWFNQRGWEQLPQQGDTREAIHVGAAKDRPSYEDQFAAIMRNRYPGGPAKVSALPYTDIGPNAGISLMPNWQGSSLTEDRDVGMGANRLFQLGDPRNIRSGPDLPPASKTTVKKTFADPSVSDTITETIKEQVPTGSAQWGNSQHPPNWQDRINPTSLMNILNPNAWRDVAKRKWLERQARRY